MEEDLRAAFAAAAPLTALVGQRIEWGARGEAPSLALYLIDGVPTRTLKRTTGLVQARVQLDCWGKTFLEAKAVGEAAVAALPAIGQIVGATKFLSCVELPTERDRFGEAPNLLHRTRTDVLVSFKPA